MGLREILQIGNLWIAEELTKF